MELHLKKDSVKKADFYLESENRNLQIILTHLRKIKKLNECLAEHLPVEIAHYCQITNLINQKLVLIAANASIATHIRFHSQDLIKKFAKIPELAMIQKIECKVRIISNYSKQPARVYQKMPLLSKKTAHFVREIAETIEDPKLREIMQRIAGREKV